MDRISISSKLADYGIDTGNILDVGKQASGAALINFFIGCLHRLCFPFNNRQNDIGMEDNLYKVRTKKILLLSNLLASSSNLLYVVLTRDTQKLDIGGMLVTISRLFTDIRFIARIKQEFIENKINMQFEEELRKIGIDPYTSK